MAQIFVSHSNANNEVAKKVRDWLVGQGWDQVFLDLDPGSLAPGQRWQEELRRAGEDCAAVVVLVSPAWAASRWCQTEFLVAVQLGKKIFPLIVESTPLEDLPVELIAHFQLADISSPETEGEGFERLYVGLQRAGLDPQHFPWPPASDPGRSPYRGLSALEEADAGVFFGRDAIITKGLDTLRRLREGARERALVIVGASGSGKSSYLRAGLLARLERDDLNFLPIPSLRPEGAVLTGPRGLAASLRQAIAREQASASDPAAAIASGPQALAEVFDALRKPMVERARRAADAAGETYGMRPPTIIIPIDQAEELFDGANAEAAALLNLMRGVFAIQDNVILLLTMRLETYAAMQNEAWLASLPHQPFNLPPLSPSAFREVIVGPGSLARPPIEFDPDLPTKLIEDLNAADALPLLAATLERLHQRVRAEGRTTITVQDYSVGLGGVAGTITRAADAALAAARADPALPNTTEDILKLARLTFVPALAAIDLETREPKRRIASMSEFSPPQKALVGHFINERLLRLHGEAEAVDVVHEAVLRQWSSLASWIAQERSALVQVESVRRSAAEWNQQQREAAFLYHLGGRLDEADALAKRPDFAATLTAVAREYLAACRTLSDEREATERARLEREKIQIRRTKRFQMLAGVFLGFAALLIIAASHRALEIMRIENARGSLILSQLAQDAANTGNYDLAARYAVTGVYGYDTPLIGFDASAAQSALARALTGMTITARLGGHDALVVQAGFSPDGAVAQTSSGDNTVRLWNPRTGALLRELRGHDDWVMSGAFSRDSARLLTASRDGTARLWRVADGTELARFTVGGGAMSTAQFSPDESRIVTAMSDGRVLVWDVATRSIVLTLTGHSSNVLEATYAPNGRIIASASRDGTARIWDAATGRPVRTLTGHTRTVASLMFSPDSARLVTGSSDETARVWDVATGRELRRLTGHRGSVASARFSSDGARIATAGQDGTARIWDSATGWELTRYALNSDSLNSINFAPDDGSLIVGSDSNSASIVSVRNDVVAVSGANLFSALTSRSGNSIVVASADRRAHVLNAETGAEIAATSPHDSTVILALFTPPDDSGIVSFSTDGIVRVSDAATGVERRQWRGHADTLNGGDVSRDGALIITASDDGTARIWDQHTGADRGVLRHSSEGVIAAAFSPNGERAVTVGGDSVVRVWNVRSRQLERELQGHDEMAIDARFSNDGTRLVSGGMDATARIWDVRSGRELHALRGHTSHVNSVAFSPDDALVATASDDKIVIIWDAASGRELFRFEDYTADVVFVSFVAGDASILTVSRDGAVRRRRVAGVEAATYVTRPARDLIEATCGSHLINGLQVLNDAELDNASNLMPNAPRDVCQRRSVLARVGDLLGLGARQGAQ